MKLNLSLMLQKAADRYQEKAVIVCGNRRLSYADLDKASNRVANALIGMGVKKGDRIAMLLENSPEFVIIYFGIVKTGAIAVPLDVKYKVAELTSLFNDCLPSVLVTESPTLDTLPPAVLRFTSVRQVIDVSSTSKGPFTNYQEIMATSSAERVEAELKPDDIAHIAYSSGPSFDPRGIVLPHQCLVAESKISGDGFQQTDKDVVPLFALPLHHAAGLTIVVFTSICKGSTVVMLPGLSINALLELIQRERGTLLIGVPFIYALLVRQAEDEGIKYDLGSLRCSGSGGAPLPIDISQRFKQHYGLDIADFWGLTETSAHVTCQPIDGSGVLGSVGKPLPGCAVKIVDDNDSELPPNQTGEILARGPLMKGYYNKPRATAEAMKNGWLHSGDLGKIDDDGNVFITGRKKDMIIVKGQNIYPGDIESLLLTHPKIAEAAAIGVPEKLRGEVVGVAVRLKEGKALTEQEIKRFCLGRIANYKVPKQVFLLESLPKTATGKVDKEGIRKRLSIPPLFPETQCVK